ncbi:polyphosphate kinase 2 family protein [Pseudonocardia sp. KRD-184]|uniref:Polyphosphate kinase 2 family protein n=1 Tax=Pseudonocardia oceani TaxID=2792013 RepID=A0ABS6UFW6_9PSEU|nr:PPK2 family polyphosphate kinase [Pseudonocardia oceani]MBW0090572.1 polyphosphate kinase 2 family protein [Pseudonocardia oceani]MBW0095502.1 polyphosphate kinase 2 family protein [Pseudonocardia oceani]MBW0110306.1 polyphosphate kinase 2 family protein [Pseudonocardia oceani]MBW0122134.1 polyphosphate kinase 2 family protein [Pseudonocardia oceani]MBW0131131.1 polyphosphate kinase 2 family protein [Pseudonocardia oceani]
MARSARSTFRVPADPDLAAIDPRGRPVGPQDKSAAAEQMADLATVLDERQEALYAEAVGGGTRAVLLVLQGMDTSGKGGVIRHVAGLVNPQGLTISSFKKPTTEERAQHFLWRVRPKVPAPGQIGVFDRSHYEDVLIARVDSLVPEEVWRGRYTEITAFESELAEQGVTVVKCMLHISPVEQAERLLARLDDPAKVWKYNTGDLDSRARWPAYQQAYTDALRETDSDAAPWYVVPSDRKWYRNWAIASILAETLAELDPRFPPATVDVDAERARIRASVIA